MPGEPITIENFVIDTITPWIVLHSILFLKREEFVNPALRFLVDGKHLILKNELFENDGVTIIKRFPKSENAGDCCLFKFLLKSFKLDYIESYVLSDQRTYVVLLAELKKNASRCEITWTTVFLLALFIFSHFFRNLVVNVVVIVPQHGKL